MINSFPIPLLTDIQKKNLSSYFDKLYSSYSALYSENIESKKHDIEIKVKSIEREMNKFINRIYNISEEDVVIIEKVNE
jgi:hypothetical protein